MSRLIDADELITILDEELQKGSSLSKVLLVGFAKQILNDAPTVDAEPVRHGRWILICEPDENGNALYQCSECHSGESHTPIVEVPYCWHCGAKMDEVTE